MTALTEKSMTEAMGELAQRIESADQRMMMHPTHMIIPPALLNILMWRPVIAKRKGVKGRRMAIKTRRKPSLWRFK